MRDDGAAMGQRVRDKPIVGDLQEGGDGGGLIPAAARPLPDSA